MEDLTDADYAHAKGVCKNFKIKSLGEYHDLYVQVIDYCYLIYLRSLEICVLKYMDLILQNVFQLLD